MARLLPGAFAATLDDTTALKRIRSWKGLIPAAIEPGPAQARGGRVYWVDIGAHPYRDWQHVFTLARLAGAGHIRAAFASTLRVLDEELLIAGAPEPSGFIFHTSRCGSTLLGKALGRHDGHIVVNQGAPLQRGFWAAHTHDFTSPLPDNAATRRRFRNLVYALTRPRTGSACRSFVKFISWNTLYVDFIAHAFADTPGLFLFRDPVEIIASVRKQTTAVLEARKRPQAAFLAASTAEAIAAMDDIAYLAHCYDHYFKAILGSSMGRLRVLDYDDLNPDRFGQILQSGFGISTGEEALAKMCTQFGFHSKDDTDSKVFEADGVIKRAAMSVEDRERAMRISSSSLAALRASAATLFGVNSGRSARGFKHARKQVHE